MHANKPLLNRRSGSVRTERLSAGAAWPRWLRTHAVWVMLMIGLLMPALGPLRAQAAGPCDPPITNPIACENSKPGNPSSEWDIDGAGDTSIQGFASDISVNKGETVHFKVKSTAAAYRLDIYRMGYYQGNGARKVATVSPSVALPQTQPACLTSASTGLIDCGNWAESASWSVPTDAVSGIYFGRLVRTDTGGASHIMFIVRDDAGGSPLLFQTSDTTWQAYNDYGGNSLYVGNGAVGRAYKVSYNRPFNDRATSGGLGTSNWVFYAEYPMVRWLEANGYNVSYFTGVDSDRRGGLIKNHKVFLSVGHDEYWSAGQRSNVEAARGAGVHLAFFSGNEVFWKTRWENSTDASNTSYRTLVTYKETKGDVIDPQDPPTWTGSWRDPSKSPPADGGRPENALMGTIFMVNRGSAAMAVPAADGKMRLWRNTSVASLAAGQTATLATDTIGYEWDEDLDNGARPAGVVRMSSTTVSVPELLQDYGNTYAAGTAIHHLTLYRHSSGALVFGAGTVQWPWGLDVHHDTSPDIGPTTPDQRMQQATVNLLADMGTQPGTLQSGLAAATASGDTTAPTSTITSPTAGSTAKVGVATTISGTAADAGGGVVGGVEVSVDGGTTWHPANGRESWSYSWTPSFGGSVTLKSRAVDDSGNIESPAAGVTVTVQGDTTAASITSVQATGITSTGATITWTTSEPSDSQVEYGTTTAYGSSTPVDPTLVTSHSVALSGLTTGTMYHYRVKSKDGAGNLATSADSVFTPGVALLVGDQVVEPVADSNAAGSAEAFQYTVSTAGTAGRLYVYLDGPSAAANVVVGLYSNTASDNPGSLLTQGTISNPAAGSWNYADVPPVNVTTGTRYWISVLSPAGGGRVSFRDVNSGGRTQTSQQTNLTALPATWSPGTPFTNSPMSAYAAQVGGSTSDTQAPTATMTAPANGATVSGTTVSVTADATDNIGVTSVQFLLDGAPLGSPDTVAPYSVTWDTTAATDGTHTLSAQASDAAGNVGSANPVTVTVANGGTAPTGTATATATAGTPTPTATPTATAPPQTCPCSIWSATAAPATASANDVNPVELGVKFRADSSGYVTGVRFYKGSGNTGTHVGSLWTSAGTLLATATFAGESASGWQQVSFSSPVQVSANTTYVASYHTAVGRYAGDGGAFAGSGVDNAPLHALKNGVDGPNGVYAYSATSAFPTQTYNATNYWVDVVFSTTATDTVPPTISAVKAASISTTGATITWTTDEAADSQVEYGTTTSYGSSTPIQDATNRVTSHSVPLSGLTVGTTYHYRVKSKDAAGNLAVSSDSSFTTVQGCPCSIWSSSATPATASVNDGQAVELGVKFRADSSGYVTGVRFYKGSGNTGTHVGSLWTSAGALLATATFAGETASGWQQVSFSSPVQVSASTTYVASYHTDVGHYAADGGAFAGSGVDNAPLHALKNGADGPNGVYKYGPSAFPNQSHNATNYWVDVVFSTTAP